MLLLAVCIVLWWRNFQLDLEKFHSISFGFLKIFKFSSQNWGWKKFRFGKFWRQNSYGSKRWFPKPIVIQIGSQTLSSMLIGIEYVRFRLLDHQIDFLIWSLSTERFSSFSLDKFHQSYDSHQQLNASVVLASKIDPKMIEQCREWIGLIFWERKKNKLIFYSNSMVKRNWLLRSFGVTFYLAHIFFPSLINRSEWYRINMRLPIRNNLFHQLENIDRSAMSPKFVIGIRF